MAVAKKFVALDTNFVLDLGGREPSSTLILDALQNRGFSAIVTPTVVFEIAHFASHPKEDCHEDAKIAVAGLLGWKVTPIPLPPLQNGFVELFSEYVRAEGLLGSAERNDGKILAEASLLGATYLITTGDIAKIDRFLLKAAYEDKHLRPVDVVDKKIMLELMRIKLSA